MKKLLIGGVSTLAFSISSVAHATAPVDAIIKNDRATVAASEAKCFDKGALRYVGCLKAAAFSGPYLAAGLGFAWGEAKLGVDWLNRFANDVYERNRKDAYSPWSDYYSIKDQRYIDRQFADPYWRLSGSASGEIDLDGLLGELKVGYDEEYDQWVLGAFASFGLTNYDGSGSVTLYQNPNADVPDWQQSYFRTTRSATLDVESSWSASIMGRVGYKLDEKTMVFAALGLALQDFEASLTNERGERVGAKSETMLGYALGAGVERMLDDNIFLSLDYRFTDFGSMTLTGASQSIEAQPGVMQVAGMQKQWGHLSDNTYSAKIEPFMHAVRVTVGYRF